MYLRLITRVNAALVLESSPVQNDVVDASRGTAPGYCCRSPTTVSRAVAHVIPHFESTVEFAGLLDAHCCCM